MCIIVPSDVYDDKIQTIIQHYIYDIPDTNYIKISKDKIPNFTPI